MKAVGVAEDNIFKKRKDDDVRAFFIGLLANSLYTVIEIFILYCFQYIICFVQVAQKCIDGIV